MRIGRAIVAVALALAVALLPVSGGAASAAQIGAPQKHDMAVLASATQDSDHATPCDQGYGEFDDCASMLGCALKVFTLAGMRLPNLAAPSAIRIGTGFTADNLESLGGAPPFRPPRS
jgi:hypothetical protein